MRPFFFQVAITTSPTLVASRTETVPTSSSSSSRWAQRENAHAGRARRNGVASKRPHSLSVSLSLSPPTHRHTPTPTTGGDAAQSLGSARTTAKSADPIDWRPRQHPPAGPSTSALTSTSGRRRNHRNAI